MEVFFQRDRKCSIRSAVVNNVSKRNEDIKAFENTLILQLLKCFCNLGFKNHPILKESSLAMENVLFRTMLRKLFG